MIDLTFSDGTRSQRDVTIVAAEVTRLDVAVVAAPSTPEDAPAKEPAPAEPSPAWFAGWTLVGVAAAGGIAATIVGAHFLSVLDDYEQTDYVDTDLEDEALTLRTATNIIAITSAVIGATGIVLLITSSADETVALGITPTGLGIRASW